MKKTILITGSTDGIGLEAAKKLVNLGHQVLIHGRNPEKVDRTQELLTELASGNPITGYIADLSILDNVPRLSEQIKSEHTKLDVIINNAGVFKTPTPVTPQGMDMRFVVNTLAPFLLTQKLLPLLDSNSRIINLSSAAQAPVDLDALAGKTLPSEDFNAYAQSKLALTMWSRALSKTAVPTIVAINPGSLLATNMVREGFGVPGKDINIGANILVRAALSDEFTDADGKYFDNDKGTFSEPHPDALNDNKNHKIIETIKKTLISFL